MQLPVGFVALLAALEQAFLGVIESARTGGGRGESSYLEHRLVQDTGIVLKSVLRDSRLEDMA